MKIEKSYNLQIWVGLREGYTDVICDVETVRMVIDKYINEHKVCVTITPTEFRYVAGWEPGVVVGLIQYPRFPVKESVLLEHAKNIAIQLKKILDQFRVTITSPKWTYLIEDEDAK